MEFIKISGLLIVAAFAWLLTLRPHAAGRVYAVLVVSTSALH